METKNTVLIVGGATGGHLFPALTLVETLCAYDEVDDVVLCVPERACRFKSMIDAYSCICHYVPDLSFSFNIISFFIQLFRLFGESKQVFTKYSPTVIVGFGSNISFPVGVIAWLKRIPLVLHEPKFQGGSGILRVRPSQLLRLAFSFRMLLLFLSANWRMARP